MDKSYLLTALATLAIACFVAGRWTAPVVQGTALAHEGAWCRSLFLNPRAASQAPSGTSSGPEVADLLQMLADNDSGPRSATTDDELERLVRELAARDPRAAMLQVRRRSGELAQRLTRAVLDVWAQSDPESAWLWIDTEGRSSDELRTGLLLAAAARHPNFVLRRAGEWAASQPALTQEIYSSVLKGWLRAGDYASAARLLDEPRFSTQDRIALLGLVGNVWAAYQPREAAQWALRQPDALREAALTAVNDAWSDADAQGAVEFFSTLPDTSARRPLMQIAVARWLASDPAAATGWLAMGGRRREYDEAIAAYATGDEMVRSNSQAALSWAERITDDSLRWDSLQRILTVLKTQDWSSADAYVRNVGGLSDEERSSLLQLISPQ